MYKIVYSPVLGLLINTIAAYFEVLQDTPEQDDIFMRKKGKQNLVTSFIIKCCQKIRCFMNFLLSSIGKKWRILIMISGGF